MDHMLHHIHIVLNNLNRFKLCCRKNSYILGVFDNNTLNVVLIEAFNIDEFENAFELAVLSLRYLLLKMSEQMSNIF